ncbi:MAG TPA: alpha/beta hydrolase [Polyangiaceae bacterium]
MTTGIKGRIAAPLQEKRATSADGTDLAYYVIGRGPRTWLMPPAMGAPLISMKHLFERFARDYTMVTWDQRGFYASGAPSDPGAMRVDDHLADMQAVVAAEKLGRFVLGGWSMAVQLSLEYYHRRPEDVRALVLINGPFERALSSVAPGPTAALALAALRGATRLRGLLNPLSRRVLGARAAARTLHRAGILAENPEFFQEILEEFSQIDRGRYFTMTRHLHAHSAARYLADVRVPTLITTGTHDLMSPASVAEAMHRAIRGSELFVVPRATHYIVAEFPELLGERIAEFLRRVEQIA